MMNLNFKTEELEFPIPWGHIAAKAWGDKSSIPVLAIHGFSDNAATFDHLIPLLPHGFYYVCLDLPSHGRSSSIPPGVALDFFICLKELRRVLHQHLHWQKCILLSHSAGGHFCLFLASLYPELITKVIILDLFPFFLVLNNNEICDRLRYHLETSLILDKNNLIKHKFKTTDKLLKTFTYKHFSPISKNSAHTILNRAMVIEEFDEIITLSDNRKFLLQLPVLTLDFHLAVIERIKSHIPILIIFMSQSKEILTEEVPTSLATINAMKKSLGSSLKIEYVDGGHNVHLDHPERVAPLITDFILSHNCCL